MNLNQRLQHIATREKNTFPLSAQISTFIWKISIWIRNICVWEDEQIFWLTSWERLFVSDFTHLNKSFIFERDIQAIWKITESWMTSHLFSHYFFYFIKKSWFFFSDGWIRYNWEDISKIHDKYCIEHDLWMLFLAWEKFDHKILDFEFIEDSISYIWKIFDDYTIEFHQEAKQNLATILQKNIDEVLVKKRDIEQKYMLQYLFLADVLWLCDDVGFLKEFYMTSEILIEFPVWIFSLRKPIFMTSMFQEIFGNAKSIKVTQENYQEIKQKIQIARENFLRDLWVENFSDKKEISQRLIERFQ